MNQFPKNKIIKKDWWTELAGYKWNSLCFEFWGFETRNTKLERAADKVILWLWSGNYVDHPIATKSICLDSFPKKKKSAILFRVDA